VELVLLSRRRALYTTKRLKDAAGRLGLGVRVLDPFRCVLSIRNDRPAVLHRRREVRDAGVVIPRVGSVGAPYAIAVVRQFEAAGIPCFNGAAALDLARRKLDSLQVLARAGVPVPPTLVARAPRDLGSLIRLVGGPPVIMKLLRGSQGTGVVIGESVQGVQSFAEAIWSLSEDVMLQQFVAESRGTDRRLIVCGGRVVAAMQRVARPGEFRANLHRGGIGYEIQASRAEHRVAVAAVRALGLQWGGVDMLVSDGGPKVIEVNTSPGLRGIEAATERNLAREIVEAAMRFARGRRKARRA
jgi:ribosomal protein S6--L-glutamate ligase